jgi:hypothetical protein
MIGVAPGPAEEHRSFKVREIMTGVVLDDCSLLLIKFIILNIFIPTPRKWHWRKKKPCTEMRFRINKITSQNAALGRKR